MKKKPFIIIPAFNEENTIKNVLCSIQKYNNNIIVIDDASNDNTYSEAIQTGVKVIRSPKNIGYDCALELGFIYAISQGATSLLSIDADGQHPINYLPKMISLVEEEKFELVIGIRKDLPRISEKIFAFFTNFRYAVCDITCGMKCYDASLFKSYGFKKNYNSIGTFLTLISLNKKHKFCLIKIDIKKRYGISRYGINLFSELKIIYALMRSIKYLLW